MCWDEGSDFNEPALAVFPVLWESCDPIEELKFNSGLQTSSRKSIVWSAFPLPIQLFSAKSWDIQLGL